MCQVGVAQRGCVIRGMQLLYQYHHLLLHPNPNCTWEQRQRRHSSIFCMQVPREYAIGTLRLSTGRHTTLQEVDRAVALIVEEARRQGIATEVA